MAKTRLVKSPFPKKFDPKGFIQHRAFYTFGKPWEQLLPFERYQACAYAVRDLMILHGIHTENRYQKEEAKRAYYLSMEYLLGRSLKNNLFNMGLWEKAQSIVQELGVDLEDILEIEPDAGLGNGGLGRLAACFMDSLASLGMPGFGYGINYEYGLFKQKIEEGKQVEKPDNWLRHGTPWQIPRGDELCFVRLGGYIENQDDHEDFKPQWKGYRLVIGVPHDMPIVGYGGQQVNSLRLFSAKASEDFDIEIFNDGDYLKAVQEKVQSETISRILYPNDQSDQGQRLRLTQEYFLVACSLQDILRAQADTPPEQLGKKIAIHLNDTHPALAIPEFMRILVDERGIAWTTAWKITQEVFSYTNHTLLPEAMEMWPVPILEELLPRHLQIIYEINQQFLDQARNMYPEDQDLIERLSIVEESYPKKIRMSHLCMIACHTVNGVAEVHSKLLAEKVAPDFVRLWPKKFINITNGVSPRRWLLQANPRLADLITEAIGPRWIQQLDLLQGLESFASDPAFQEDFRKVKTANKDLFANKLWLRHQIKVETDSLFDSQAKRIHEYKRQLMFLLYTVHCYLRLVEDGIEPLVPRTFIFSGKAAPGYKRAKEIIYLIHEVGRVINEDPRTKGLLRVLFVPNYSVTEAEYLIPATDLSEQISTAGYEASGTGNMKFAMNGALTIGTFDGANIEIRQEVGPENIFLFGHTVDLLTQISKGGAGPRSYYERNEDVKRVLDSFLGNRFTPDDPGKFCWIFQSLVNAWDPYFHLADLAEYFMTQDKVSKLYGQPYLWTQKAILNVARIGKFSSDRCIQAYARDVWGISAYKA